MTATVANDDYVLKSSVESLCNVGSSNTCKNAFLIRLKQYENEGSTSLSLSGNSNFQHENVQKNITKERTVDINFHSECKKAKFNTASNKQKLNFPVLHLPDKLGANAHFVQNLEFKSPEDDAWYAVSIKYGKREGQPEEASYFDVHYEDVHRTAQVYIVNLKDNNQVEETRARFRCKSCQLRSWMCDDVQSETPICAAYRSNHKKDTKYFDAVLKKINKVLKEVP